MSVYITDTNPTRLFYLYKLSWFYQLNNIYFLIYQVLWHNFHAICLFQLVLNLALYHLFCLQYFLKTNHHLAIIYAFIFAIFSINCIKTRHIKALAIKDKCSIFVKFALKQYSYPIYLKQVYISSLHLYAIL